MATYNRDSYLPRSIRSLLAQTDKDWEAVIVDDGSTDNTSNQLQALIDGDCRFKVVRLNRNSGVSRAKNVGIRCATGKFVTFLDSDDEYHANHLDSRRSILETNPNIEFLHGGFSVVGNPYVPDANNRSRQIDVKKCVLGGTFFVRRDIIARLGGFPCVQYAEDTKLLQLAKERNLRILQIDDPTYVYYRNTPGQITLKTRSSKTTKNAGWVKPVLDFLSSVYKTCKSVQFSSIVQRARNWRSWAEEV